MRINLPLLGAIACAVLCAGPALAAPVFYCDAKSARERAEEIRTIKTEYLPGLKEIVEGSPLLGDQAHAGEEFKEWTARLAELELGEKSCKELREFERPKRPRPDDDGLVQPVIIPGDPENDPRAQPIYRQGDPDNDPRAAPPAPAPNAPDPGPTPQQPDDLLVQPQPDDLLVPVPAPPPRPSGSKR